MRSIDIYVADFLRRTVGVSEDTMWLVYPLTAVFVIFVLSQICAAVFRFAVVPLVQKITARTRVTWDETLFSRRVMRACLRIIPPVVWAALLPFAFRGMPGALQLLQKVCYIYLVVVSLMFVSVFLDTLYEITEGHKKLRNRPLKGIYQMFNLMAFVIGCILVVSIIIDKSAGAVLAGLGASAAIIMLVFKDTVLGLVAGVQLTANDMLRPGDWITMSKYGADGFVREVTLTTVKVQNFDNTITTIPPYLLVSDSFQNWRGMRESGGRRLKLHVSIDVSTVSLCGTEAAERHAGNGCAGRVKPDGEARPVTNLRLYRDFMCGYLNRHPDVNKDMMIMVRMLQPTPEGLPLELYCFSVFTEWLPFERFRSEVLDYAIAMAPEFGLRVYQRPAGSDFSGKLA